MDNRMGRNPFEKKIQTKPKSLIKAGRTNKKSAKSEPAIDLMDMTVSPVEETATTQPERTPKLTVRKQPVPRKTLKTQKRPAGLVSNLYDSAVVGFRLSQLALRIIRRGILKQQS